MKEKFKALGDFVVIIAKIIIFCVVVFYYFRGLNWIFVNTLPLNPIDFPPFAFSIIVTCLIVLFVIWVLEKPTRQLVKEEKNVRWLMSRP